MSTELYEFILALSGSLIALLLLVIGFFLRRQVKVTETLNLSVVSLQTSVELLKNNQEFHAEKHETIDKRLDAHSIRLSKHERAITEIKTRQDVDKNRRTAD